MAIGIGAAKTAVSVANKAADQSIALGKLSAASYHDFLPNGLAPNPEVMGAPLAQQLIREIQGASPSLSVVEVKSIAQEIIQSGASLPRVDVA